MKVISVIQSIDKNAGGTSNYMQLLANHLGDLVDLSLYTLNSPAPLPVVKQVNTYFGKRSILKIQGFSNSFKRKIKSSKFDLIHTNGLWGYPMHIAIKFARRKKTPYIISPHGMLEPWSLLQGKWKKKLALLIYQSRDLRNASCIHATAQSEAKNIHELGFKNPIAVIPNGIDLEEFPYPYSKPNSSTKTVLFLSRIHPKKGIELLVEAWEKVAPSIKEEWNVELAGNGEEEYIQSLQNKINKSGVSDSFKIIGPQFGKDKLRAYQRANLFVLPTYSENFGIVVAEALACGIPVITTNGTPWQELNTSNSGWCIDLSVDNLKHTLETALTLDKKKLEVMGINGRKLIEDNYSIDSVALKMKQLYEWISNKTAKPDFVF